MDDKSAGKTTDSISFLVNLNRVTGGELFDRIVEKGSYTEKDAADLIRQVNFEFKSLPTAAGQVVILILAAVVVVVVGIVVVEDYHGINFFHLNHPVGEGGHTPF